MQNMQIQHPYITVEISELPTKVTVMITEIINSILRVGLFPIQWTRNYTGTTEQIHKVVDTI